MDEAAASDDHHQPQPEPAPLTAVEASWTDSSTAPCQLTITNSSPAALQLVWRDYDGGDVVYNIIDPGTHVVQGGVSR